MTRRRLTYVALAVVFVAAYALAATSPAGTIVQAIAGNAGLAALVVALFQIVRDSAAHERSEWLQRDNHGFQVGVTSHMANVVFDKHVAFCEEYFHEVTATVRTLFREHATPEALEHANNLYRIRQKHGAWLTATMTRKLVSFEDALRKLGAQAGFLRDTHGVPEYAEQRRKTVGEVYAAFDRIVPALAAVAEPTDQHDEAQDVANADNALQQVREILEIERLVSLRTALIERAHSATKR